MPRNDRGIYRGIYASLIDDLDFQSMKSRTRHVFLTLRLSEQTGIGCIFRFYYEPLQQQTGYTKAEIDESLSECAAGGWIKVEWPLLWIINGLRYDPYAKIKSPKIRACVLKHVKSLPKLALVREFCEFYGIEYPFEIKDYSVCDTLPDTLCHTRSRSRSSSRKTKTIVGAGPTNGSHRIKLLLTFYEETYVRLHKERPVITGADIKAAQAILKNRTEDVASRMVKSFLENPPDLYRDKALFSMRHIMSAANTLLARREVSDVNR